MKTHTIIVKVVNGKPNFPKNAQLGDLANVYFPPRNGQQLVHQYSLTMKGWVYYGFQVLYDK